MNCFGHLASFLIQYVTRGNGFWYFLQTNGQFQKLKVKGRSFNQSLVGVSNGFNAFLGDIDVLKLVKFLSFADLFYMFLALFGWLFGCN